jgi:hypothetical protein
MDCPIDNLDNEVNFDTRTERNLRSIARQMGNAFLRPENLGHQIGGAIGNRMPLRKRPRWAI